MLAARRGTEERLTAQAHSLLHKLSGAEGEAEGLHTALAEAVAKTAAQLARRGAFCDAAGEGLGAAQARLASLQELLTAHRAASAEAAAGAEAAARAQAEALRGAASELMATGSTEVAAAAAALEAAAARRSRASRCAITLGGSAAPKGREQKMKSFWNQRACTRCRSRLLVPSPSATPAQR